MYLFNTTFIVSIKETDWWSDWMEGLYIPTLSSQVADSRVELYKIYDAPSPSDEPCATYSCQWQVSYLSDLKALQDESETLFSRFSKRMGTGVLQFSTLMKGVEIKSEKL